MSVTLHDSELDLQGEPRKEIARVEIMPATGNGGALTPAEMLDRAVSRGATPETIGQFMDLYERFERRQERKAFDGAMAEAKAEIPVILKNREVDFTSQKGRTHYRHEDLAQIARTVDPILAKHGLSYRFRTTSLPSEPVTVTCVVSHRDGYSEENTLSAGRDESGNKNSIQAVGSAITYLQRYTLKAALGLAASNDDDARSAGEGADAGLVTEEQAEKLKAKIVEAAADLPKFLAHFGIEHIEDMPAKRYDEAYRLLTMKKARASS